MAEGDVVQLLDGVAAENPAGEDLWLREDMIVLGDQYRAAINDRFPGDPTIDDPAPWRQLAASSTKLLRETKDVWLAVYLTAAKLKLDGIAGLKDGLLLLQGLLDQYWDTVYPRHDPEDEFPVQRINAINELASANFLNLLRGTRLFSNRQSDCPTLRELLLASGAIAIPADSNQEKPDLEKCLGAIRLEFENARSNFDSVLEGLKQSFTLIDRITAIQAQHVGKQNTAELADLSRLLTQALEFVEPIAGISHTPISVESADHSSGVAANGASPAANISPAEWAVRSRDDVVRALERVAAYYSANEPTSPVPLLLGRVKRLVTMDFLKIIEDLVPDATKNVRNLAGLPESDGNGEHAGD